MLVSLYNFRYQRNEIFLTYSSKKNGVFLANYSTYV